MDRERYFTSCSPENGAYPVKEVSERAVTTQERSCTGAVRTFGCGSPRTDASSLVLLARETSYCSSGKSRPTWDTTTKPSYQARTPAVEVILGSCLAASVQERFRQSADFSLWRLRSFRGANSAPWVRPVECGSCLYDSHNISLLQRRSVQHNMCA